MKKKLLVLPVIFILLTLFTVARSQSFTRERVVEFEVKGIENITLTDDLRKISFMVINKSEQYDWFILIRSQTGEPFYIQRDCLRGTLAFGRTPLVLLMLQYNLESTASIGDIEQPHKAFILRRVGGEYSIFQENVEVIDGMFDYLQNNLESLTEDSKSILGINEPKRKLVFNTPNHWFWLEDPPEQNKLLAQN